MTGVDPKDCKHLTLRGKTGTMKCPECYQHFILKTVEIVGSAKHKVPHKATQGILTNNPKLGWYSAEAITIGDPL